METPSPTTTPPVIQCLLADENCHESLAELLETMLEFPEREAEITDHIHELFEQIKAVLVLDMSGFTKITAEKGIVSFLKLIHLMWRTCKPCVLQHGGELVKAEADNIFCLFPSVAEAVEAAQEIMSALAQVNQNRARLDCVHAAIGIGFGKTLYVGNEDLFGCEVNLTSKLGEDIAQPGEILLTEGAYRALQVAGAPSLPQVGLIPEMGVPYYQFRAASPSAQRS